MSAKSNTRTISRNSLWYALDASAATLVMLLASVPVARIMGPEVLGHYIFLLFVTNVASRLGNIGIPATACKYMSEYLAANQPGLAHEIFQITFRYQAIVATVITAIGCLLVQMLVPPDELLVSYLVVLSIWPGMLNSIPAQANVAAEDLKLNIPASFIGFVSYALLVTLALVFGWGLPGLAIATLASRSLEAGSRYWSAWRWIHVHRRAPIPNELRGRMFAFSQQNLVLLAVGLIVWDRSELLFLRSYREVTEVAFYSLAFSITAQLQMAPRAFSASIGYTMLAQYGRDQTRLESLMQNATRYVWLIAVPMFLGLASVARPLIETVYGARYLPAVPALIILSVFSIPRAFQAHSESLLQATEAQGFMVKWLLFCAALNLSLDWFLIPRYGAIGAAVASGTAQTVAVMGVWFRGSTALRVKPPWRYLRDVSVAGLIMAACVFPIERILPAPVGLAAGCIIGVMVFAVAVRLLRCLTVDDVSRLAILSARLPKRMQATAETLLRLLAAPTINPVGA